VSAPTDLGRVVQINQRALADLNDRPEQSFDELSDDLAEQVLLARYSALVRPELDAGDPNGRRAEGDYVTWMAALVRDRKVPRQVRPLFDIFLALFPRAFWFWMYWLEAHEGKPLPNFIPADAGHLSAIWQLAWAASANSVDEALNFVPEVLESDNALARFAILHFAELTLRFSMSRMPPFLGGSGTVAADTLPRDELAGNEPAISALNRLSQQRAQLSNFSTTMSKLTIDLIASMKKATPVEALEVATPATVLRRRTCTR